MTVAENIKRIRIEKGLTQKQLGEKCGMSESTLRQYEIGYRNPKIETLHKIANGLGVSIILLVDGCEDKYPLTNEDYQMDIYNSMTDDEKELAAQHGESAVWITKNTNIPMQTIAAHFDGDEYTDEELEQIRQFAEFVKSKRKNEQLNAAHADDYSDAPEELKKQEEDIMDDENF